MIAGWRWTNCVRLKRYKRRNRRGGKGSWPTTPHPKKFQISDKLGKFSKFGDQSEQVVPLSPPLLLHLVLEGKFLASSRLDWPPHLFACVNVYEKRQGWSLWTQSYLSGGKLQRRQTHSCVFISTLCEPCRAEIVLQGWWEKQLHDII